MAAACSPPWRRVGGSRQENFVSSPSGSKLGPNDVTPERPFSRNTASPEDSCAICLGAPENKSFTDSCFHTFCFACLAEWAKVKAECPLCKQRFKSIIHSVRSLEDYDQYFVNELQLAPPVITDTYGRRFQFPTTMTVERRQEMEAIRQEQGRRTRQPSIVAHRNQNRYLPRGAITSAERFELYLHGLWAVPRASHYRQASPEFYRDNPACTHRLVPWLNRELNALMQERRSHIMYAMDYVISLIMEFDIRHPEFARRMEAMLHEHTEHFVHEFYTYATSVHDMAEYDQNTVYKPHHLAFAHGNPINRFRQALLLQAQVAASASRDESPAIDQDSPQPGPSGLAVAREEVIATTVDTDSDSSDCVVVKVVKPQRERTPVVIDLSSSDEDDRNSGQEERPECPPQMDAEPSHPNWSSADHRPHLRHAAVDSSSSDDEHLQRRHSRTRSPGYSELARDRRQRTSDRGSSSQFDEGRQRQGQRVESPTYALESWSSSSDEIRREVFLQRKRKKNLVQREDRKYPPETDARPSRSNCSLAGHRCSQRRGATDVSSYDERPRRRHAQAHSPEHSTSTCDRRRRISDARSSSHSDIGRQRQGVQYVSTGNASEDWNSTSYEEGTHGSRTRKPKKLVSVVGAVNMASMSCSHERHHSHHHHHRHRHHHDQRCRKHEKHEHKRRNPL